MGCELLTLEIVQVSLIASTSNRLWWVSVKTFSAKHVKLGTKPPWGCAMKVPVVTEAEVEAWLQEL